MILILFSLVFIFYLLLIFWVMGSIFLRMYKEFKYERYLQQFNKRKSIK